MPSAWPHPQPCARKVKAHKHSHHRLAGHSGIPCAMVLRFPSCSSRGPGFLAPVITRIVTTQLGISVGMPEPHDFAVRIEIVRPRAKTRAAIQGVHRIPRSTFVTIAKRPSCERGTARIMLRIFGRAKRYSETQKQPGATRWHDGQFAQGAQAFAACAHLGPSSSRRASREAESGYLTGPAPCVEAVCSAYRFGAVRWTRLNALPNALSEA
jgi:hypothetical protein